MIGAALVVAIPFATSGRVGILGQGLVNDDMASHLLFTEWISSHAGPTPDLIKDGYPLGPHAIVAATAKVSGASLIEGFAGLTGAIAVLLALTAYGALERDPRLAAGAGRRAGGEPLPGAPPTWRRARSRSRCWRWPLLGFALALPAAARHGPAKPSRRLPTDRGRRLGRGRDPARGDRRGHDLQLQLPGPRLAARRRDRLDAGHRAAGARRDALRRASPAERLRGARSAIALGIAIPVVAALPEIFRLASFSSFKAFNPSGTGPTVGFGNLRQPLNPLEAFGIWPSGEFRITPANSTTPEIAFYLGAPARPRRLRLGPGRALSRRESALPSALLAATLLYLASLAVGTPYTQAKALAIAAPLIMLIALRGLLSADSLEGEEADVPEGGGAAWWPPRLLRPFCRLRRAAAHARLRRRGGVLDPAAAAPGGGRARLPPPGDAPHAADRRRPERALPRPRQLRLLGADRLGGLRADHQPLRRRGGPLRSTGPPT